jgi:60 kDa SS-A/Ro ribonucleoprotein
MTNAGRLAAIGGGGTNCSAPVRLLNQRKAKADLVLFISDNQSWVDQGRGRGTALLAEWSEFLQRNPKARLVCLDVQPNQTTQAVERVDILNIGGFSDQAFEVIAAFASGRLEADHWLARIEAVAL